jgi:hypothetical protein
LDVKVCDVECDSFLISVVSFFSVAIISFSVFCLYKEVSEGIFIDVNFFSISELVSLFLLELSDCEMFCSAILFVVALCFVSVMGEYGGIFVLECLILLLLFSFFFLE